MHDADTPRHESQAILSRPPMLSVNLAPSWRVIAGPSRCQLPPISKVNRKVSEPFKVKLCPLATVNDWLVSAVRSTRANGCYHGNTGHRPCVGHTTAVDQSRLFGCRSIKSAAGPRISVVEPATANGVVDLVTGNMLKAKLDASFCQTAGCKPGAKRTNHDLTTIAGFAPVRARRRCIKGS
jgi:hypothetical protein